MYVCRNFLLEMRYNARFPYIHLTTNSILGILYPFLNIEYLLYIEYLSELPVIQELSFKMKCFMPLYEIFVNVEFECNILVQLVTLSERIIKIHSRLTGSI